MRESVFRSESFVPGPFDAERLDCYVVSRDLLAQVARLARGWRGHADLADQATRAATSVLLNIAEGAAQPRGSGSKRRHYAIARASAGEVAGALDAALLLRLASAAEVVAPRTLASRVCAMLAKLCGR